jgi:hypothetical protein
VSKETVTLGDSLMIFCPFPESSEMINSYITRLAVNQWFAQSVNLPEKDILNKNIYQLLVLWVGVGNKFIVVIKWIQDRPHLTWTSIQHFQCFYFQKLFFVEFQDSLSQKIDFQGLDWLKTHIYMSCPIFF